MAYADMFPEVRIPSKISIESDSGQVFELAQDAIEALTQIALRNRISYPAAISQVIANEIFLTQEEAKGAKFLIERQGEIRYLERRPQVAC